MKSLATFIALLWVGIGLALFPKSSESQQQGQDVDTNSPQKILASAAGPIASQPSGAETAPATPAPAPAPASEPTSGIPGIISLKENGVSDAVILHFAKNTAYDAVLNSGDILYLKEMSIGEEVIAAAVETAADQFRISSPAIPAGTQLATITNPQTQAGGEIPSQVSAGTQPPAQSSTPIPGSAAEDPEIGFFPVEPPAGTPDYNPDSNYAHSSSVSYAAGPTYDFQDDGQHSATVMATPEYQTPDQQPVYSEAERVEVWREQLSPHGEWIYTDDFGWCWRPSVVLTDTSWRPYYSSGRWVNTDLGWYWKSGYSWGHIAFHYGRWWRHASYGWMWYPDTVWAPSWVSFRRWDAYCGWAPLPPLAIYRPGAGFFYGSRRVGVGFSFGLGSSDFTFVSFGNFCDPYFHRHVVAGPRFYHAYHHSTVINNYNVHVDNVTVINNGVPADEVERISGTKLERVAVRKAAEPLDDRKRDAIDRSGKVPTIYREELRENAARASLAGVPSTRNSLTASPAPIPQTGRRTMPPLPGSNNSSASRLSAQGNASPSSSSTATGSRPLLTPRNETGTSAASPTRSDSLSATASARPSTSGRPSGITIRGDDSSQDISKSIASRNRPAASPPSGAPSNVWSSPRSNSGSFSDSRSRWNSGNLTPAPASRPDSGSSISRSYQSPPVITPSVRSSPSSGGNRPSPRVITPPRVQSTPSPSRSSIPPSRSVISPSVRSTPSASSSSRPAPRSVSSPSVSSTPSVRSAPSSSSSSRPAPRAVSGSTSGGAPERRP